MCLLTFYPSGVGPDVIALTDGAYVNPDGHGFAIVAGERLIVRRGMDADRMVAAFERMRDKYPDGPALFHSRLASHGRVGKQNCHPFRIGGDRRTVVAHNGILPKNVRPTKGDKRSDTRIAAEDFLPYQPFGSLDSWAGQDRLTRWLGQWNKIVILTVDPSYRENAYVLNEEHGSWMGGVWYSNLDFLVPEDQWDTFSPDDAWECVRCRSIEIDPYNGLCTVCEACPDCGEFDGYCSCYAPASITS